MGWTLWGTLWGDGGGFSRCARTEPDSQRASLLTAREAGGLSRMGWETRRSPLQTSALPLELRYRAGRQIRNLIADRRQEYIPERCLASSPLSPL